jgi:hypothetical protein
LLFDFALEYATGKFCENQEGMKLSGIHQFLVYADDINLLDENKSTLTKIPEALLDVGNEVRLEVNAENNKYMCMSHFKKAGNDV